MADIILETVASGNNIYEIFHNEAVATSRCYSRFMRSLADSLDSGHIPFGGGTPWFTIKCGILYIVNKGNIVGHMTYGDESTGVLYLVNKEAEGEICELLFRAFEKIAKNKNCWAITTSLHIDDENAINAARSVGMKDIYYQLYKKI